MTEIRITRHGQPLAVAGAAESSSRAAARDEDSSAPTTGRPASAAPGYAGSAGSPAAFGAHGAEGGAGAGGAYSAAGAGGSGHAGGAARAGHGPGNASASATGEHSPASGTPSAPQPSDTAGTDGAGATSSGATAHEEIAHAPSGEDTTDGDGATEIEGDLHELVKKAKQRDEYLALAQRTQADFENYRKRVAKDAHAAKERGVCALAKELLPALDNLDRALEAAAEDDPLLQGVRLARSELAAGLARLGIESFSPLGERFDPEVHEAVATAPASDGQAGGTVSEVYQAGYRLGETVIRPARVVVAA